MPIRYQKEPTSNVSGCLTSTNDGGTIFTANSAGIYQFTWTDFSGDNTGNTETLLIRFTNDASVIATNCIQGSNKSSTQHAIVKLEEGDEVGIVATASIPEAKSRWSGKRLWCGCV